MIRLTVLAIDIETFSDISIDNGVYKYVDSDNFKILLFAYAFDNEDVQIIDIESGEELPEKVASALLNPNIIKTAFNAQFERVSIDKHFGIKTFNWECTMVLAWSLGISGGLDMVGKILKLNEDKQKLATGKKLIKLFSLPKPIKDSDQTSLLKESIRVKPADMPVEWQQFKEYCIRDVDAERGIRQYLLEIAPLQLEDEIRLYQLDQKINDRGVKIDLQMAEAAINIDNTQTERLTEEFTLETGLINPNSLTELKAYISTKTGKQIGSITKDNIKKLMKEFAEYPDVVRSLEIRQQLSKTSVAKYKKMVDVTCSDGRARGLLQFYGASTGRWAGRLIQVQNLPQNHISDLNTAREVIKTGDLDFLNMMYPSPSNVLSQCIRPTIIPEPGHKFVVSDFSAIEARVIAWFANEKWRLDVFSSHGKIYEASASQMFKVPLEEIHKGHPLRQKGKIAELALGYQGSVGALKSMKALEMGLTEEELQPLVNQWRAANPKIVKFWYDVEAAAMEAIENRSIVRLGLYLRFIYKNDFLFIELPSGRRIAYAWPRLVDDHKFNRKKIVFESRNSSTKQWGYTDTYGGKLVENIVQAAARDCLAHSMIKLDDEGYDIVMTVHDEIVIEIEKHRNELKKITALMGEPIPWAPGLLLRADGYECDYYQKD